MAGGSEALLQADRGLSFSGSGEGAIAKLSGRGMRIGGDESISGIR